MQIRGRVLSISGNVAEVCIMRETTACGSCSTCPKKMGVRDIVRVAAVEGIQVGQEVVLRSNINWFFRNRIMLIVGAFVLGILVTEIAFTMVSLESFRGEMDLLGGGILTLIAIVVIWRKKPQYLFRIEQIKEGRT